MQPYSSFAAVYDLFMDNIPYDDWTEYILMLLNKHQIGQGLILELGCGTGKMTRRLAKCGFDMIGIDNSEEMLAIAREKSLETEGSILYLCQDMREFELYGTVAAVISVCDSMNYILSEEDLLRVFRLVNNYLDPAGLFVFDLDTEYAYQEILGDTTIAEHREEGSFIWENSYYEEEKINEINLTLFLPVEEKALNHFDHSTLCRRYEETHHRKAYTIERVKSLIEQAGMEWVAVYDAYTVNPPIEESERVYIIAREKRQVEKLYI